MNNLDTVLLAMHERLFPLNDIRPESADESRVLWEAKQSIKDLFLELIDYADGLADFTDEKEDVAYYMGELRKKVEEL